MTNNLEYCEHCNKETSFQYIQHIKGYTIKKCLDCYTITKIESNSEEIDSNKILLSIIIPSYKRPELLKWGLYSLSQQITTFPFEIIVLNDGIKDETENICNSYQDKLNIRYIYIGHRNEKEDHWRIPGYAINIGVKQSLGENIILSCPEIFIMDNCLQEIINLLSKNKKLLINTNGFHEKRDNYINQLKTTGKINLDLSTMTSLDTELPFFIAMNKEEFINIGGYDEDFIGYCWDDNDIISRLKLNKCTFLKLNKTIIHLWHDKLNYNNPKIMDMWRYNKNLYDTRRNMIIRNESKEWGVLKVPPPEDIWVLKNIPKIAHFYWGHPYISYLNYLSIYTFQKYNPDWDIRLYYPKKAFLEQTWKDPNQKFTFKGKDYCSELKKLPIKFIEFDMKSIEISNDIAEVFKSEYLKNYLLSTIGGLWSDMDILYFKPMNKINVNIKYNEDITNVVSIDTKYTNKWFHSIGFLLSSPNNEYHDFFFKEGKKQFDPTSYQSLGAVLFNKICPSIISIHAKFPNTKAVNMSYDTVYAYGYINRRWGLIYNSNNTVYYTNESIGCHWYGGWKEAEKYINEVNDTNYKKYNNVLCKTIRMALND
jgi:glycosyltransferase involved in cell wall biosynthesis